METSVWHSILMVEDDPDDRYLTQSVFEEHCYNVKLDFLADGEEVLAYLDTRPPDMLPSLIVLDKNLPAIDGLNVLREVKEHPRYRYIPVVMVSGTVAPGVVEECYRAGANSFFQKPESDHLTRERISTFLQYWLEVVDLPKRNHHTAIGWEG